MSGYRTILDIVALNEGLRAPPPFTFRSVKTKGRGLRFSVYPVLCFRGIRGLGVERFRLGTKVLRIGAVFSPEVLQLLQPALADGRFSVLGPRGHAPCL